MKIAIIGAGISGLSLAHYLKQKATVTVFEKSRGVSGRMSTRYVDNYQFDHGCAFFSLRDDRFKAFLASAFEQKIITNWQAKIINIKDKKTYFQSYCVACPKMNALNQYLAQGLNIKLNTAILNLEKQGAKWTINTNHTSETDFDWVISSAPAPQSAYLFPTDFKNYQSLQQVEMSPCFSLMLGLNQIPKINWHLALVQNNAIESIYFNSTKPNRNPSLPALVIHTTHNWAKQNCNQDKNKLKNYLLNELIKLNLINPQSIVYSDIHRWLYAKVEKAAEKKYLLDEKKQLAAIGDWCIAPRVESAFLSAYYLAQYLLRTQLVLN